MQFPARIVDNAQLRKTNAGQQVTDFTVAINDNYTKKDGTKVQNTTYFDCSVWNRPNITPHLKKGRLITLTGFPSARAWTGRDGEVRTSIGFRVDDIDFLSGGNENPASKNQRPAKDKKVAEAAGGKDDDLPF